MRGLWVPNSFTCSQDSPQHSTSALRNKVHNVSGGHARVLIRVGHEGDWSDWGPGAHAPPRREQISTGGKGFSHFRCLTISLRADFSATGTQHGLVRWFFLNGNKSRKPRTQLTLLQAFREQHCCGEKFAWSAGCVPSLTTQETPSLRQASSYPCPTN